MNNYTYTTTAGGFSIEKDGAPVLTQPGNPNAPFIDGNFQPFADPTAAAEQAIARLLEVERIAAAVAVAAQAAGSGTSAVGRQR